MLLSAGSLAQCLLLLLVTSVSTTEYSQEPASKPPIVLIPGFASSRLLSWSFAECGEHFDPAKAFAVEPGQRIWLDSAKVVMESFLDGCWLKCMRLNYVNQTDSPECKIRPMEGIDAIRDLDPGLVTGPLSAVFRSIINDLAIVHGYESPNTMVAAPFDFRLPPSLLEKRDKYFTRLRWTFEKLLALNNRRAIVICHSLGNNVFRYFIEWLKIEQNDYEGWLNKHIKAYYAAGAPSRGAPQAVKAVLSGETFGLPITQDTARYMSTTFGSAPWMMTSRGGMDHGAQAPVDPIQFIDAKHVFHSFNPEQLKELFSFVEEHHNDVQATQVKYIMEKYYENDPILDALSKPADRPPIQDVHCVYGIDIPTEVGYVYESGQYDYDDDMDFRMMYAIIEEEGGRIIRRKGNDNHRRNLAFSFQHVLNITKEGKSGDGTVPYYSLSWCHQWHEEGSEVKVTHTPPKNLMPEVEKERTMGLALGLGLPSITSDLISKVNNFLDSLGENVGAMAPGMWQYESEVVRNGQTRKTSVIEFQGVDHRDIIKNPRFFDILGQQIHGYCEHED